MTLESGRWVFRPLIAALRFILPRHAGGKGGEMILESALSER